MPKVIKAENISKAYQLGDFGTGTISRDLERFLARLRGKEDPFLKIGEINDRTKKGKSDVVWSLKDINFEVEQGDTLGIIGRNGAGKSTLLKILARVTSPSTGSVKIKGRVASLLEVGTGFHPELTGKENIYLNGTILGMRKAEIKRKFDEIVDFAGVERYIGTPVKRYSSGMYVRLAFAVAAHLESEILIVDEVLAVGDAEFQKKCLGKMGDISKGEGRTILFVSHNMGSIMQICNNAMLLKNGGIENTGQVQSIVNAYLSQNNSLSVHHSKGTGDYFNIVALADSAGENKTVYLFDEGIFVQFNINLLNDIKNLFLSIIIKDSMERPVFTSHFPFGANLKGHVGIAAKIPSKTLIPGNYFLTPVLHIPNVQILETLQNGLSFSIEDTGGVHSAFLNADLGAINIPVTWREHDKHNIL
jgi:lipopolysaccharide transport system ATP-binding protein